MNNKINKKYQINIPSGLISDFSVKFTVSEEQCSLETRTTHDFQPHFTASHWKPIKFPPSNDKKKCIKINNKTIIILKK
jgi:hypothetical protein